jgi:hypothetical protein
MFIAPVRPLDAARPETFPASMQQTAPRRNPSVRAGQKAGNAAAVRGIEWREGLTEDREMFGTISRRRLMKRAGLAAIALGGTLAGLGRFGRARAEGERITQAQAQYRPRPNGIQRCEICLQFAPPKSCKLVAGEISPKGWCRFFAGKENAD